MDSRRETRATCNTRNMRFVTKQASQYENNVYREYLKHIKSLNLTCSPLLPTEHAYAIGHLSYIHKLADTSVQLQIPTRTNNSLKYKNAMCNQTATNLLQGTPSIEKKSFQSFFNSFMLLILLSPPLFCTKFRSTNLRTSSINL